MDKSIDIDVDSTDDILISESDILVQQDFYTNMFRNAERRLSGRVTDFVFINEISAGIESMIDSDVSDYLLADIESNIRTALLQYGLLETSDFDVYFNVMEDKVGVMIKFNVPDMPTSNNSTFSVFINRQNQRSYR